MKKFILAIVIICVSIANVQAQKKTALSIAANAGIPTTTGYSVAWGLDLQADFAATQGLKITASGGYENFSLKKTMYGGGDFGLIPLLAGVKFNLGSEKLYGHAQLGYSVATKGGGGSFTYAPSIGYYFSPNFDGSIKYMGFDHLGEVGARLAYNF